MSNQQNNSSRLIAFVGAGASSPLYPLWPDLIDMLGQYRRNGFPCFDCGPEQDWKELTAFWTRFKSTEPAHVVQRIKGQFKPVTKYYSLLKDIFSDRQNEYGNRYTFVHERIATLEGLGGIITLNYDDGLKYAIHNKKNAPPRLFDRHGEIKEANQPPSGNPDLTSSKDSLGTWLNLVEADNTPAPPILHLHGHYSKSESTVLDFSEYRDAYDDDPWVHRLLKEILGHHRVIFIGFGFSDTAICKILSANGGNFFGRERPLRHRAFYPLEIDDSLKPATKFKGAVVEMFKSKYQIDAQIIEITSEPPRTTVNRFDAPHDSYAQLLEFLEKEKDKKYAVSSPQSLWEKISFQWREKFPTGLHAILFNNDLPKHDVNLVIRVEFQKGDQAADEAGPTDYNAERERVVKHFREYVKQALPNISEKLNLSEVAIYDNNSLAKKFENRIVYAAYPMSVANARKAIELHHKTVRDSAKDANLMKNLITPSISKSSGSWSMNREDCFDLEVAEHFGFFNLEKKTFNVRLVPTASLGGKDVPESEWEVFKRGIAKAICQTGTDQHWQNVSVDTLVNYGSLKASKKGLFVGTEEVHLAYVGPFAYVRLAASGMINPLATRPQVSSDEEQFSYNSVGVVREDSDIGPTLTDIISSTKKGKVLVFFGDKHSTSGFLLPFVELMSRGFYFAEPVSDRPRMEFGFNDPSSSRIHIADAVFGESHYAVLKHLEDPDRRDSIVFVDSEMLRLWREKNPNTKVKIVWISKTRLPAYPWVSNRHSVNLPSSCAITNYLTSEEMKNFLVAKPDIARLFGGAKQFDKIGHSGIYDPVRQRLTEALVFVNEAKMAHEKFIPDLLPN